MNTLRPTATNPTDRLRRIGLAAGVIIFLLALGSGCSTNGHYADGINHWPVQVKSVDSGSN
jgi:hypothetical protein